MTLEELEARIAQRAAASPDESYTAKLIARGIEKAAQKLGEEATEAVIAAVTHNRAELVKESADLIYNLVVLWAVSGVRPGDVWGEMQRRERLMGIAEKLPKKHPANAPVRRKVVALEARRHRKRHR